MILRELEDEIEGVGFDRDIVIEINGYKHQIECVLTDNFEICLIPSTHKELMTGY